VILSIEDGNSFISYSLIVFTFVAIANSLLLISFRILGVKSNRQAGLSFKSISIASKKYFSVRVV
jgi:hypothetical protein